MCRVCRSAVAGSPGGGGEDDEDDAVTVAVGGPVSELLAGLRSGKVSAREVTLAHLAALRRLHARTGAIAAFQDERALADADGLDRALSAGVPAGPLHGL